MYLQFKTETTVYELNFTSPLNLIIGDTTTGKTELIRRLNKSRGNYKTDAYKIFTSISSEFIDSIPSTSMVILDMDELVEPELINAIVNANRSDICWVLIGRKFARRIPVAMSNTFKFYTSHGITKNIQFCDKYECAGTFSRVVVEDSNSGLEFIRNSVDKNAVTSDGAPGIIKDLRNNSDTLYFFDAVGFGGYIEEFMSISKGSTRYVAWPSFEGFLLTEKFNCDIDYSKFNTEEEIVKQLRMYNRNYSKRTGCCDTSCVKCIELCKDTAKRIMTKSKYSWAMDSGLGLLLSASKML